MTEIELFHQQLTSVFQNNLNETFTFKMILFLASFFLLRILLRWFLIINETRRGATTQKKLSKFMDFLTILPCLDSISRFTSTTISVLIRFLLSCFTPVGDGKNRNIKKQKKKTRWRGANVNWPITSCDSFYVTHIETFRWDNEHACAMDAVGSKMYMNRVRSACVPLSVCLWVSNLQNQDHAIHTMCHPLFGDLTIPYHIQMILAGLCLCIIRSKDRKRKRFLCTRWTFWHFKRRQNLHLECK